MVVSSVEFIDIGDPSDIPPRVETPGQEGLRNPSASVAAPGAAVARPFTDLPYTFAKRHGVILERSASGEMLLVHRPGVQLNALSEARRKAGQPLKLEAVSADDFDARLTRHYEGETGQAIDIMDDFGDDLDLAQLAESLPEP